MPGMRRRVTVVGMTTLALSYARARIGGAGAARRCLRQPQQQHLPEAARMRDASRVSGSTRRRSRRSPTTAPIRSTRARGPRAPTATRTASTTSPACCEDAGYEVTLDPVEITFNFPAGLAPAHAGRRPTTRPACSPAAAPVTCRQRSPAVDINLAPPRASTSGCDGAFTEAAVGAPIVADPGGPDDFAGFPAGNIALIQRGGCSFALKAVNAQAGRRIGGHHLQPGQRSRPRGPDHRQCCVPPDPGALRPATYASPSWARASPTAQRSSQAGSTASSRSPPVRDPHRLQRHRGVAGQERGQRRDGRRPPRQRDRGPGDQRQRLRLRGAPRDRAADGQPQPGEHAAVRLVGRRGAGSRRLGRLRRRALAGGARPHRAVHELRHGRLAELHLHGLRRRRVHVPGADGRPIPPGSAAIEDVYESYYTAIGEPYDDTEFSGAATTRRSSWPASRRAASSPAPR